ncbi:MAG TPA: zinc-binding dehydrogenase [Anaerolineae bacterium]|nr:zinc-binding dehydrogenase [Anaerolineae bacterium]
MKAYVIREPGSVAVLGLEEVPMPVVKPGWVLIKVKAFGLNRAEIMTRQGHSGEAVAWPRVIGIECVGEVADASDSDLEVGQKVATAMGGLGRRHDGSYAEYVLVPSEQVMPVETTLSWAELGALPEMYLTAWGVVHEAMGITAGQTVLVRAGTSSVGRAVIDILKDMGCMVIATTRQTEKRELLFEAGADRVLVTAVETGESLRRIVPAGVHGVVELVGTRETIMDSLEACGTRGIVGLVGFLGYEWDYDWFPWMPSTVRLTRYDSETVTGGWGTAVLRRVIERVEAGRYKTNLFRTFAFDELPEAHQLMEANEASGKLVVLLDD